MKKVLALVAFMVFMAVPAMAQVTFDNSTSGTTTYSIEIGVTPAGAQVLTITDNLGINVQNNFYDEMKLINNKTDIITNTETITKDKDIDFDVNVTLDTDKAAEAIAVVKGVNDLTFGCENCSEKVATIFNSILDNVGIVNVNQASGHINNQGNVISLAVDTGPVGNGTGSDSFVEALASVEQLNTLGLNNTEQTPTLNASIQDSILRNIGIVNVNQSVGNMNNQHNVIALGVSLNAGVAMSEADLGQENTIVSAVDFVVNRNSQILGSINGNRGIVNVNQTAGVLNNQANVLSIAVTRFSP